jgi:hypothetical protein
MLIVGLALVASLGAGAPLHAGPAKPLPPDVGAGRIAWFDITTTDLAKSKAFYGGLFGWAFAPVMGSDLAVEIQVRGRGIGTIRTADGPIGGFNGVVYVQVADLPASCARTKDLGGTVVPGFPFNLPDGTGAIAVIVDPSGHPLGLYSRTRLPAAPAAPTPAPAPAAPGK